MTLSSRHRIRNSSPGGLRPSTLPFGHGGSPQYWLSHVDGEETFVVSFKPPRPGTRQTDRHFIDRKEKSLQTYLSKKWKRVQLYDVITVVMPVKKYLCNSHRTWPSQKNITAYIISQYCLFHTVSITNRTPNSWKAAMLTTTLGPPPCPYTDSHLGRHLE